MSNKIMQNTKLQLSNLKYSGQCNTNFIVKMSKVNYSILYCNCQTCKMLKQKKKWRMSKYLLKVNIYKMTISEYFSC